MQAAGSVVRPVLGNRVGGGISLSFIKLVNDSSPCRPPINELRQSRLRLHATQNGPPHRQTRSNCHWHLCLRLRCGGSCSGGQRCSRPGTRGTLQNCRATSCGFAHRLDLRLPKYRLSARPPSVRGQYTAAQHARPRIAGNHSGRAPLLDQQDPPSSRRTEPAESVSAATMPRPRAAYAGLVRRILAKLSPSRCSGWS